MAAFADIDWNEAGEDEQLRAVRKATTAQLNQLLRSYDWSLFHESVLGWAMAQKGLDMSAALSAFFNGDPMRFNYVPNSDVPASHRGICRLLDSIAQRVNAGFYLPGTIEMRQDGLSKLHAWIYYQQEDVADRRRGRWVFDEETLEPILHPHRSEPSEPLEAEPEARFSLGQMVRPLLNP
ncbi:hypothetical protein [Marimonas lutisalis]|uniref:hypothetical protein n=1 Tax=Marimonas lutisalis TaxID=2545756 RepID=UPI0010F7562C|nr:hypothetical protein [Marimonas lutisalis]